MKSSLEKLKTFSNLQEKEKRFIQINLDKQSTKYIIAKEYSGEIEASLEKKLLVP